MVVDVGSYPQHAHIHTHTHTYTHIQCILIALIIIWLRSYKALYECKPLVTINCIPHPHAYTKWTTRMSKIVFFLAHYSEKVDRRVAHERWDDGAQTHPLLKCHSDGPHDEQCVSDDGWSAMVQLYKTGSVLSAKKLLVDEQVTSARTKSSDQTDTVPDFSLQ